MAGLIQDSNANATYEHSAAAMKKGGFRFSGRKPLDGLSNSGNPFLKKASEKMMKKKKFAVIEEEIGARAKNISKNTGTRKVLSDITNSRRNPTLRKKQIAKLTAVTDDSFNEEDIAEGLQHDHRECIKIQHQEPAMDMDYFFKTLQLANGCPKELPSLKRPETPPMTPPRLLEEMLEQPISDRTAKKFDFSLPESPGPYYPFWDDRDISLKLLDSPKLVKH